MGFEPMVGCDTHTDLANRRFRPLSHLSMRLAAISEAGCRCTTILLYGDVRAKRQSANSLVSSRDTVCAKVRRGCGRLESQEHLFWAKGVSRGGDNPGAESLEK